jgi:uncharacterized protein (TIGR03435 family)
MPRAISVVLCAFVVFGQTKGNRAAFEAASVRLNQDATARASLGPTPGGERFRARCMPLLWLIGIAYNMSIRQISGLPDSFGSRSYDIDATCAHPASRKQMMEMLQTLLEERFKLRLRHETKELSVYVLTVARGGAKLEENKDGADLEARNSGAGREAYRNFPMPIFASILVAQVDDAVVDKTRLAGSYDFKLEFTPERVGQGAKDGHEAAANPDGASLLTALREQLGLELQRKKIAVEVLAIDHVEELSDN